MATFKLEVSEEFAAHVRGALDMKAHDLRDIAAGRGIWFAGLSEEEKASRAEDPDKILLWQERSRIAAEYVESLANQLPRNKTWEEETAEYEAARVAARTSGVPVQTAAQKPTLCTCETRGPGVSKYKDANGHYDTCPLRSE